MVYWPTIIRVVDSVEGAFGIALNCAVMFLIWRGKYRSSLQVFRICITITSLQGLLMSGLVIELANTNFGRFIAYFAGFSTCCMFQLIPGACLIQYCILCKPHFSMTKKFLISYGPCSVILFWDAPYFLSIYPSRAFSELVMQIHQPSTSEEFVALGGTLMPTKDHPNAVLNLALECILPTYSISYGTLAFCFTKCRRIIAKFNVKLSAKTLAMHHKFLVMLALQNLLPLVVMSIPMGFFLVGLVGGYPMGLWTLVLTFSFWTLPIIQGSVALRFAMNVDKSAAVAQSTRLSLSAAQTKTHN